MGRSLYDQHGSERTKGIMTYVSTEECNIGHNQISEHWKQIDSSKECGLSVLLFLFWYAKD